MSQWSIRHWSTALIAAAGTVAALKLALDYRKWKIKGPEQAYNPEMKDKQSARKPVREGLPSNGVLLKACYSAIQKTQANDLSNVEADQLTKWLRSMTDEDIEAYSPKARLFCAQWLLVYHTSRYVSAKTVESYKEMVEGQVPDLRIAWRLLQCLPDQPNEQLAVRLLQLDVGQKLKDHWRMIPVFDSIMQRLAGGENLPSQEVLIAFTTAPLLGRWEAMRKLGRLVGGRKVLEELHIAALKTPEIPDYKILFECAEDKLEGLTDRAAKPEQLRWTEYLIKSLRIKLESVQCSDEMKREDVKRNFQAKIKTWKIVDVKSDSKMLRLGALNQMLSFSFQPIPMVGPASDTRMHLRGYAETAEGFRQSEEIRIENKDPGKSNVWEGQYVCVQEDSPKVTVTINMQITLEEQKQDSWEAAIRSSDQPLETKASTPAPPTAKK